MNPIDILLVEDNPADADLFRENLADCNLPHELHVVTNGDDALAFLRAGVPSIHLVLLDLNMPGKDGRQTLAEIKADPNLRRVPVVVLTSSDAEADIAQSYDLHANAYIVKPLDIDGFANVVGAIDGFWSAVRQPEH